MSNSSALLKRVLTPTNAAGEKLHATKPSATASRKAKSSKLADGTRPKNMDRTEVAIYKPLPKDWQQRESYLFYGWTVSDPMLHAMLGETPLVYGDASLHTRALLYLERCSRFQHLMFVNGQVQSDTPADRIIQLGCGGATRIFALSCTRNKKMFLRRPSKAQMKILVEMFGEEPRWYDDLMLKHEFRAYGLS